MKLLFLTLVPQIVSMALERPVKSAKDFPVNMTCSIASHFILHDADIYWFKNGFEKSKFRRIRNEADGDSLLQSTTIELTSSSNDSYSHQGYYQCFIFAPRFMKEEVRSPKLQIQFQGNNLCIETRYFLYIEIYLVKAIVEHLGRIFHFFYFLQFKPLRKRLHLI